MLDKLFPKEYFQDRRLMLLATVMVVTAVIIIVRVLLAVRSYDYKVTIGYTQYGADSFELGDWYTLYEPAVFTLITSVTALLMSFRLYRISAYLSFLMISLQLIVQFFVFIVASALLDASSIVT